MASKIPYGIVTVNKKLYWHYNTFQIENLAVDRGIWKPGKEINHSEFLPEGYKPKGALVKYKFDKLMGCNEYFLEVRSK